MANEKIKKNNDTEIDEYEELTIEERLTDIEKKMNIMLFLGFILVVMSVITIFAVFDKNTSYKDTGSNTNSESDGYSYSTEAFKEIKAQDIKSESKGQTIVVLIGRQGCGYCVQFAPIITEVAKEYGIQVRYIDYMGFAAFNSNGSISITDTEAYDTIKNLEGEGEWAGFGATALSGTPNTLIIKNNVIIGGVRGSQSAAVVESAFKEAGFSKK